uniref:Pyrin domain-containing protein n=1 Tax=Labrus bergylta TaxID=56723 RepID=A0A3Q3EUV8_9LABR
MAPKTKKAALADMLENLSESNFDKFCSHLLDRREEPRVRRRQVEGKNFLQIADVLVSTFTEAGAVKVAVELLGCANFCPVGRGKGGSLKPIQSFSLFLFLAARPSAGAAGVDTTSDDQHFVDKYKLQLTDRVSHMDPILDRLLDRALPTSQKKMRELYCGCLKAGAASKDIFYQILLENEKFLIDDLNTKH